LGSGRGELGLKFGERGVVLQQVVEDGAEGGCDGVAASVDIHLWIRDGISGCDGVKRGMGGCLGIRYVRRDRRGVACPSRRLGWFHGGRVSVIGSQASMVLLF
jgi:hypothetical protein